MATVEKSKRNVAEASRRILDPLQRLRVYIRLFVSIEAAAIVLLCIFACAWISFTLDYGAFKLPFSIDWVQFLPWTSFGDFKDQPTVLAGIGAVFINLLRIVPLVGVLCLVLLLIATKAIVRLIQRFRDSALALELERRFPRILGDRLITAVELANRGKVIEQGYSTAMVDETIVEAAQRVEKLPIREVFRWRRLWFMGAFVVLLTFGLYFFNAVAFASVGSIFQNEGPLASFSDYNEVLGIWFERNVLMENTIWPRKVHLVFVDPEDGDLRIGRDKQPPAIKVRAWEYVIADSKTREGWRPLAWKDFDEHKYLLGDFTAEPSGTDVKFREDKAGQAVWKFRDEKAGLTVDDVALFFANKFDMRKGENPTTEDGQTVYDFPGAKRKMPFQWGIFSTIKATNEVGWRELTWNELNKDNLNRADNFQLPALPSKGWKPPLTPSIGYTVDEVEAAMAAEVEKENDADHADVHQVLRDLERLNNMRKTIARVDERVAASGMRRTMRKLLIPNTVTVAVTGPTTYSTITLTKTPEHEYTGQFGELKEKKANEAWVFTYKASGEDYTTAPRKLTIVPPPSLLKMYREEMRPAYIYYFPGGTSNATVDDIKGKKQPIEQSEVSLMGGDLVTVDCPAGTDLTLIGETDKELRSVKFTQIKNPQEVNPDPDPEVSIENGTGFRVTFLNVRRERTFEVEMLDTDKVRSTRKVRIRPTRDSEPSVDLAMPDWVRHTKDGYMVTARGRIPFTGKIKDDHGLAKVQYVYTVSKIESTAVLDVKALHASGVIGMMAPDGGGVLHGTTFLAGALSEYEKAKNAQSPDNKNVKYYPRADLSIPRFESLLKNQAVRPDEFISRAEIERLLLKPQAPNFRKLLSEFEFEPDPLKEELTPDPIIADFPVSVAKLLGEDKSQARYRLTLWVEATDNDLDSTRGIDGADGPKIGASKERIPIIVVSEEELNSYIGQDEAKESDNLSISLEKLQDAREKLAVLRSDLDKAANRDNLNPLAVRSETLEGVVDTAKATAHDVLTKYRSLFKELKGNDIQGNKIKIVLNNIIDPLDTIDGREFRNTQTSIHDLRLALEDKGDFPGVTADSKKKAVLAAQQLDNLIEQLQAVLNNMQKQIELNKVVEELRVLLQNEERIYDLIKKIKEENELRILNEATNPK